ncbi:MAG: multi-sensor hybrid histidine kinase [Planctomycetaceae bacterium]|nr:multi-sensor hybrid histidine kinase [Planctomycetaceae bacterium]
MSSVGLEKCFPGGGEMSALMRTVDWSRTPVGPVADWPQCLKVAIRILLTSRYAMWMAWGPDLTFFYNDAYRPTLGVKASRALAASARTVWAEIWPEIGPRVESVLQTGTATWDEALLLFLERSGYPEETYHTFSYSPLMEDDGHVAGMLCVVTEETERVIGDRRLVALRDLASLLAGTQTESEVLDAVRRNVAAHAADLPFTLTYLFEPDGMARLACQTGVPANHPIAISRLSLDSTLPWPLAEVVSSAAPVTIVDLADRFGDIPQGPWNRPPQQAVLVPLAQQGPGSGQGRPAGVLIGGINPYRPFDASYRGFVGLLAGQISAALANAWSYEEERKRAESLAELDRAKTAFFSNVSYEFRTPLTLLLAPVEDLLARSNGHVRQDRELLEVAHRNALRLQKLVNTLLDFSRIEAGRVQIHLEPTDLAALTTDLASLFRSAIERAGLQFIVDCPTLPVAVDIDRDMWEKIVLNLLSNALKFTFEGSIEISLKMNGRNVELRVRDSGTGIPAEQLGHIFERFHRVEGARGRTHEGTGIGLALVQELAKLHSGCAGVTSILGEGTTFTVTVPAGSELLCLSPVGASPKFSATPTRANQFVHEAGRWLPGAGSDASCELTAESPAPVSTANSQIRSQATRSRVIVADDNADMRNYIRRLLGERYAVAAFSDGGQAFEAALADRPDLVLTDVMMPELDGFGLLQQLRSNPQTASIPVIILSARAGEEARMEGLEAGADDYLVKPFSARELTARVSGVLELARVRQEAAQRESELRAEAQGILESITESFTAVDANWQFTYVNKAAEQAFGIRRQDLLGKVIWDVFPPTIGTSIEREIRRAMTERIVVHFDEPYEPLKGWFEVNVYPTADGGISVFFRDIAERKRSELLLSRQRDILEAIVEAAPLEEVLERLCELVEEQSEERILASVLLLDDEKVSLRSVAGKSIPQEWNDACQSIKIGPAAGSCGTAAYRGTPVIVSDIATDPLWADYRAAALGHGLRACWSTPIFSSERKVLGTFAFYYHGTHRPTSRELRLVELVTRTAGIAIENQRAEGILRTQNERLRLLWEAAEILLTTDDPNAMLQGLFTKIRDSLGLDCYFNFMVNDAGDGLRLTSSAGISADAANSISQLSFGQAACGAVALNRKPITMMGIQESQEDIAQLPKSLGIRCYAGNPLLAGDRLLGTLSFASRTRDRFDSDELEFLATISHYVTAAYERLRLIGQLRESDRRKDEFLATLAHELRNPMAPIRNGLRLLQVETNPEVQQQALVMMERQLGQLVRLVDDLLDISRITRNRLELRKTRTDLRAVVENAVETARPLIESNGHTLTVKLPPKPVFLDADLTRLAQVFWNLLNNSAKYTEPGGQIWLTAEREAEEVVVTVRDTGIGIPRELQPRLFELFSQLDQSLERSQGGLGIGLALVKGLTEMHGGTVSVSSLGYGQGTSFIVRLPLATGVLEMEEESPPDHDLKPREKLRILVVDDNRDGAASLAMFLSILGNNTRTAHDGLEAVELADAFRPDVIVLDIGLPKLNGYDACRKIRSQPWGQKMMIIAATGWGQEEDRRRTKEAGFDHHLVKPIEPNTLQALLADLKKSRV